MPTAQQTRIGSLDCIVVDGGPSPKIAVVICHGYGDSCQGLAPFSGEWINLLGDKAESFRFIFPNAPNSLADQGMPEGRAWWPINMARLAEAMQTSSFEELHEHEPPGIAEARGLLCGMIQRAKEDLGGADVPLVMGGFSQGAMLTMDASLRGEIAPPQWLFQFSGTIVCRPQWQASLGRLAGTKVFQSHGTIDPILPYTSAVTLSEMLKDADVNVKFHSFVGPHTIDVDAVVGTAQALAQLVD